MRLIRHFAAARRLLLVSVVVLAPTIGLAAGCSSVRKAIDNANASAAAYSDLQGFIRDQLTTKFSRSVRSVSCTPHVDQVLPGDTADLTCAVVFTDGTSYVTPAKITDPSTDPDIATESFSFNDPPALDITTAPLPSQLVPAVIQRLTELITTKGKVRLGSISRFVLTNSLPGGNSGWTIYLTSGSTRFQALVLGNDPRIITPSGTHDLR